MNTWMILWFVTLITSSFVPRTWRNMNNMFDLFWTSSKKLNSTLSWKNVNSIKPKWNSSSILFLKMAFTWILVWSLNHCGLDYLKLYSWCLMFFGPKHLWTQALKVIFDGKPFLCQICENVKKNPFAIGIKGWWNNQSKVKKFLAIMTSLSFKMFCYIMMNFCIYLMALFNSKYFKLDMMFQLQATFDSTRPWS